ncbi:hypothetical protein EKO27_g10665 [Xylaria grammica]|uniref:Uncharacterized protein n=1 Tax=Xylaria grammica TaxID=363999 RepID=A0A439CQK6_9PEZI|nr:hypothetical protein EKO27_g10665 [Xylaria grammica]
MQPWSVLSTAMVLFCAGTVAQLVRRENRVPPEELDKPSVEEREEVALKTVYRRTDPASTTASHQPTTTTPYAVPLTTTFIPPESCNQGQYTQLSSPGYYLWLNEPVPVPGTTISDCYPREFMEYYTNYHINPTNVGSRVPLMSPLVCPFGCGYGLTPPETPMDPNRPAYGGTCYNEWPLSSSTYVAVYGSASSSGFSLATATTPRFANYAHVIDGIVVSTSNSLPAQGGGSESTSLAPGAIAGIVVGVVAALGLLAAGFFLYARNRRRQMSSQAPPAPPPKDEAPVTFTTVSSPIEKPLNSPVEVENTHTTFSEMEAGSQVHELDAGHMPVEKP